MPYYVLLLSVCFVCIFCEFWCIGWIGKGTFGLRWGFFLFCFDYIVWSVFVVVCSVVFGVFCRLCLVCLGGVAGCVGVRVGFVMSGGGCLFGCCWGGVCVSFLLC